MTTWSFLDSLHVFALGRRLAFFLVLIAIYFVITGLLIRTYDIGSLEWGSAASLVNTVVLGLLLGFRNRVAYDRWWEARRLWGQLTIDSRNLAAKLAAYVPTDVLAPSRVGDVIASFALALNRHLRDEALRLRELPGFETDAATPTHLPLYVARRLFALLADWKRAGHFDGAVAWILDVHARSLLDVSGACERIRFTPLTPAYKSLLRIGLVINFLAAPWLIIPEVGKWGLPVFVATCFFLLAVELIDSFVEEPFGREREDLDLDRYCQTIRDGVTACLN